MITLIGVISNVSTLGNQSSDFNGRCSEVWAVVEGLDLKFHEHVLFVGTKTFKKNSRSKGHKAITSVLMC